jgi:outer membrane autotransporter protein
MNMPESVRLTEIKANQYASLNSEGVPFDDVNKAIWVKPYTSFEKVPLHNGPTVENISYGTLIGGDSDFIHLKHGWTGVVSPFIGYNGAHQTYSYVDSYQNGGTLGVTGYLYKGNFFSANTLVVGASVGEASSKYGSDTYTMLSSGIATRNGYNFEFEGGKYIIQPSVTVGYMYSHTFDYMAANGAKITDANLHVLQVNPTLKFIVNLKNEWQPYMQVGMIYNVMNECGVKANDVALPSMTERSYVEYGIGLQRHIKDRFTSYLQAMIHNGGRNGIVLSAGFSWFIGKNPEKVQAPSDNKLVLLFHKNKVSNVKPVAIGERHVLKEIPRTSAE